MGSSAPPLKTALAILLRRGWLAERSERFQTMFAEHARVRRYGPDEALYRYGEEANGIFGLVDGAVDVTIPRMDGMDLTIHRADAGFWIGDLALFVNQTRLVSVTAKKESYVVHVSQLAMKNAVEQDPSFYPDFYSLSYTNMKLALELLANLATPTVNARVAVRLVMLESEAEGSPVGISQHILAELVGISATSVHRAIRHFEKLGLIETGYGWIKVLDRVRLIAECERSTAAAD